MSGTGRGISPCALLEHALSPRFLRDTNRSPSVGSSSSPGHAPACFVATITGLVWTTFAAASKCGSSGGQQSTGSSPVLHLARVVDNRAEAAFESLSCMADGAFPKV
mmetsp:Transcript_95702/g.205344  ORF Transcript_95702/g.205344 Transcript_95702/m.205344 type:complete len:107 (+) Transcript_95702:781-1101(+)